MSVELVEHRSSFTVGSVGDALCSLYVIKFVSHNCHNTDCTAAVEIHSLEHRSKLGKTTLRLERGEEIEQCLVSISLEKVGKLLHLYASYLSELGWLLENLGNEIHHCSGSSLILLHILV